MQAGRAAPVTASAIRASVNRIIAAISPAFSLTLGQPGAVRVRKGRDSIAGPLAGALNSQKSPSKPELGSHAGLDIRTAYGLRVARARCARGNAPASGTQGPVPV